MPKLRLEVPLFKCFIFVWHKFVSIDIIAINNIKHPYHENFKIIKSRFGK